jgi:putative ABC transport system permease protein
MVTVALENLRSHLRRVVAAAIAIVLGVGFLAATLVIGDTMRGGFAGAFVAGNDGTAVVVRSDTRIGDDDLAYDPGSVPVGLLDQLLAVPGVDAATLHVRGLAQILSAGGHPLGGDGPPTLASNWIDDPRLSPWRLVDGRSPSGAGEVVIDRASARAGDLSIGSVTTIRTPDPVEVTIVGIATFGAEDSLGPTTQVLFDTRTAQELMLGGTDRATDIRLAASAGVDEDVVADRVAAVLPPGTEAITGSALSAEQLADLEDDFIGFFHALLLVFAGIGLLVATLTIHNTFSIIVAQRARGSALLRALGASRTQVVASVALESLVIALVASAAGVATGLVLAALALWGMDNAGFGVPGGMQWSTTSLVLSASVGVIATMAATVVPAVTASRVPPLAAIRDVAVDRSGASRVRVGVGTALGGVAVASVLWSPSVEGSELPVSGLGIVAAIAAAVLAGPALAVPVASGFGWPIARMRGRSGLLARRNAVRNPRRTASTATSLMVGVGVVVLFVSVASSLTAYIDRALADRFAGDLVIDSDSFSGPGLGTELAVEIDALRDVELAVPVAIGVLRIGDEVHHPTVADLAGLAQLLDVEVIDGSLGSDASASAAVSRRFAGDRDLSVGDSLSLTFGSDDPVDITIGAIYAQRDLAGDLLVDRATWEIHGAPAIERMVMIGLADGVTPAAGRASVAAVAATMAAPPPLDRDEYVSKVAGELDQVLAMVFALLAVAVVIAVMGIGNTMSLSVHERTRELGLLRAVGMTRPRVRAAVRWESVIVASFGCLTGVALGTFGAWGVLRAIEAADETPIGFSMPVGAIGIVLVLGAACGVAAGLRPAARAARVDVLDAIAAE